MMTTAKKKKQKTGGRQRTPRIERADQLGDIKAVATYMGVGRTWLSGVKRRYLELAGQMREGKLKIELPQAPFAGGKTCADWVLDFVRHPINADFVPTRAYKTRISSPSSDTSGPPSPHEDRAASASDKSD